MKNRATFVLVLLITSIASPVVGQLDTTQSSPDSKVHTNPYIKQSTQATHRPPAKYDPLKIPSDKIETVALTVTDLDRKRDIPLLVYLPKSTKPSPVIVHSHGLGGTKNTSQFLGKHWASRGYVCVFTQHFGSDDSVWKNVPRLQIMRAMKKAASMENSNLRVGDVHSTIDQLEAWNTTPGHPLKGRLDLDHIGMSGHSFGAVTTQRVSGQAMFGRRSNTDPRIKAAIPMSPSSHRSGDGKKAFGKVSIPWLCMTGTKDIGKIGGADLASRLGVFPGLPKGGNYELVLFEAEHNVFTETSIRAGGASRNPNHHPAIKAVSTAFWDAYLKEDKAAKSWLNSDAIRSVLEPKDSWKTK